MARNTSGKWVARAGATGGSRSYRGQTPVNWYAALVVIVLLGVLSVVFANYEYRHPSSAATTTTKPGTTTTWFAGISFDVCGKTQPSLAANVTSATSKTKSFFTTGNGVLVVAPKSDTKAGKNAVLDRFVAGYPGLILTSTELQLPVHASKTSKSGKTHLKVATYKDGQTCKKGTPDAGKKGQVTVTYWSDALENSVKPATVTGDPGTLRFTDNQLITVGFVPAGTKLAKDVTVVEALLKASTGAATTSTTTTTAPGTTTTTGAATTSTTTTAPPATTTTAPPATTTTAPATTTTSPKNKK